MKRASCRYPRRGLSALLALAIGGCASVAPDGPAPSPDAANGTGAAADLRRPAVAQTPRGDRAAADSVFVPDALPHPGRVPWLRLRAGFRLPEVERARLRGELERYRGRQAYFEAVARRARPYLRYILDRIEARDLPAELALIPVVESAFRPFAYSHARAGGLWQFKPMTGRRFGLKQNWWYDGRRDVLASTDAALDYLSYLHEFFDGDWLLAIAAYNGGEGTVRRAVRANREAGEPTDYWHLDLPTQTEHYVPRLLALRAILRDPAAYGVSLPQLPEEEALEVVETGGQVDLAVVAEMTDLTLDTLYHYNAGLNRWATPPGGPHRVVVPADRASRLRAAMAERAAPMVRWQRHPVAAGETLSGIASEYGTTVSALRRANDLRGSFLRVGQDLIVPTASRPDEAYSLSRENRREAARADGPPGRTRIDYRVRAGDTLWEIARRRGVEVARLADWNDMAPGDPIRPGQQLAIWVEPAARVADRAAPAERMQRVEYTVRAGDSLYAIARRFNVAVDAIRRWNDLATGSVLQPGQRLQLRVDVTRQALAE